MNKIGFSLLISMILVIASFGQNTIEIKWQEDYDDALAISKKENKPLLIFYTGSDWCGPCMQLDKDFFETEKFNQIVEGKFILYKADVPRNRDLVTDKQRVDNKKIEKKYQLTSFPTVIIANKKGKVLALRKGYNMMRDPSYHFNMLKGI